MKCPQCKEQMKQSTVDEITVDECARCRGMWFDSGDLDEVKDKVLPDMGWLDIDAWKELAEFDVRHAPNRCPKCKDKRPSRRSQSNIGAGICQNYFAAS